MEMKDNHVLETEVLKTNKNSRIKMTILTVTLSTKMTNNNQSTDFIQRKNLKPKIEFNKQNKNISNNLYYNKKDQLSKWQKKFKKIPLNPYHNKSLKIRRKPLRQSVTNLKHQLLLFYCFSSNNNNLSQKATQIMVLLNLQK